MNAEPRVPSSTSQSILLSLGGAALLAAPAFAYRIDRVGCWRWPPLDTGLAYAALYLAAVALLTAGWMAWRPRTAIQAFAGGLIVHLAAIASPPFLSRDPLFYAAVGRACAWFGGGGARPLAAVLPPGDPFLAMLPERWRSGNSPYFGGFDAVAGLVARLTGNHLTAALKVYQGIGMLCMLATALLVARHVGRDRAPRAIALVLLCPVAVVEGTLGAHNDALLAVAVAAFAWAAARGRAAASLGVLAAGLAFKASALLPLALRSVEMVGRRLGWTPRWRGAHLLVPLAFLVPLGALLYATRELPALGRFSALVGSTSAPYDLCTRSLECLPRVLLRFVAHRPDLAWATGLGFRLAGALLIAFCGLGAGNDGRSLRWMGVGLFLYYLFLHGWAQTWYFLAVLPLLPHVDGRMARAMRVYCVSGVAYYALVLPFACVTSNLSIAWVDAVEAAITILPPTVVLLRPDHAARLES